MGCSKPSFYSLSSSTNAISSQTLNSRPLANLIIIKFSLTHAISSKTLTSWPLVKQPNITFMALAKILINVSLTHAISSQTLNSRLLAKLIITIALADTCNQQPSIIFKALDRINIIFIAAHANSNQTLTSWPQANKIRISSTTKILSKVRRAP